MEPIRRMFVADVAKYRMVSISAARAWLAALERNGSTAVRRHGTRLYTTEAALRALEPHVEAEAPRLEKRLRRVEVRLARAESVIERLLEERSALPHN